MIDLRNFYGEFINTYTTRYFLKNSIGINAFFLSTETYETVTWCKTLNSTFLYSFMVSSLHATQHEKKFYLRQDFFIFLHLKVFLRLPFMDLSRYRIVRNEYVYKTLMVPRTFLGFVMKNCQKIAHSIKILLTYCYFYSYKSCFVTITELKI